MCTTISFEEFNRLMELYSAAKYPGTSPKTASFAQAVERQSLHQKPEGVDSEVSTPIPLLSKLQAPHECQHPYQPPRGNKMNDLAAISKKIITLPGRPLFMLDRDVAELYETKTMRINEAVKRNPERFPEDFYFELTAEELQKPIADCDRFDSLKHSSFLPFAFTREGCNMLSAVLSTSVAIARSIQIMRAFSFLERSRSGGGDAAPSPLLPNGWQMYELRMTYGTEKTQQILKELFGVFPGMVRREISAEEAEIISVNNPNVNHRNHMIWELKERGLGTTKLSQVSGLSRQSVHEIWKRISHIRTKALGR